VLGRFQLPTPATQIKLLHTGSTRGASSPPEYWLLEAISELGSRAGVPGPRLSAHASLGGVGWMLALTEGNALISRLRKNQVDCPKQTSAAKVGDDSAAVAARLKSSPSQNLAGDEFFRRLLDSKTCTIARGRTDGSGPAPPRNPPSLSPRGMGADAGRSKAGRSLGLFPAYRSLQICIQLLLEVTAKNAVASCSTFLLPQYGQEIASVSCSVRVMIFSNVLLQSLQM